MSRGKRFVTKYNVSVCYGGPEEGGWYYRVTEVESSRKFSRSGAARVYMDKQNSYWDNERRHGYDHELYVQENHKELGHLDNSKKPRPIYE